MTRRELRSVLVHVPGTLGEQLAGPEIRALEFAKALSTEFEITLAAPGGEGERDGMRLAAATRRALVRESARHDAILSACLPPYLLALKPLHGFLAITDQYDPHELEIATKQQTARQRQRELRSRYAIQALQLRHADVVLCAAERQRTELLRVAGTLDASSHGLDPVVLPFGIPDPPPPSSRRPLHEHFPELARDDTVVLWWGSVWRWLDAETPVRAFARLAASRLDIKLVITAGRPPSTGAQRFYNAVEQVRELAAELGVLGRNVLFYDQWIPYEQRHDYLREADIGLTLHRHAAEARLAARARYMDYLSAELPCVLGHGDETAEEFGMSGFARLLESPDPDDLAAVIGALADDPRALAGARQAGRNLVAQRRWSVVGGKLRAAVAAAGTSPRIRRRATPGLLAGAGAYYARRLTDRVATSADRRSTLS